MCYLLSRVRLFVTPWGIPQQALCPWDFPGKNTGVDFHSLLQGIFLIQVSNPGLLHCRRVLYQVHIYTYIRYGLPRWQCGNESACHCRKQDPWVGKIPYSRKWYPAPVFLLGRSHGQRSLVVYSP